MERRLTEHFVDEATQDNGVLSTKYRSWTLYREIPTSGQQKAQEPETRGVGEGKQESKPGVQVVIPGLSSLWDSTVGRIMLKELRLTKKVFLGGLSKSQLVMLRDNLRGFKATTSKMNGGRSVRATVKVKRTISGNWTLTFRARMNGRLLRNVPCSGHVFSRWFPTHCRIAWGAHV